MFDNICLSVLFAIDKIHLVKKLGKSFRSFILEIEKIEKKKPYKTLLLGVSVIVTKKTRSIVVNKARFCPKYKLMQISLDELKIMHIY